MKDRLLIFLNKEGISATSFADKIGVQRSSISHILSGRNNPSYDFILKTLENYHYLNAEWLITGRGEMYTDKSKSKDRKNVTEEDLFGNPDRDNSSIGNINNRQQQEIKVTANKETNEFTFVNNLVKIVFFYQNGTFKEYNPSE